MTSIRALFKHASYDRPRPTIMRAYVDQMVAHLATQHPGRPLAELQSFVETHVKRRFAEHPRPVATILDHPQPGTTTLTQVDLLQHLNGLGDLVIVPSGTAYLPPTKQVSLLRKSLEKNVARRNKFKKVMLEAAERGDKLGQMVANSVQNSAKITNNAVLGGFGSAYNALYDMAGYNAVTSGSRHSVRTGFPHIELLVEGNLLLLGLEDVINYCVCHHRQCPTDVLAVCERFGLKIPSIEEVVEYFYHSVRYYRYEPEVRQQIHAYIASLPTATRTYAFYGRCLRNLVVHNDAVFRAFFAEFFRTDVAIDASLDVNQVWAVEGDLLAMVQSLNYELIGKDKLADALKSHPDGVRHLIAIARHMEATLERYGDLFRTFFLVDIDIANVIQQPFLIRQAVGVSDTDSVIFSTQTLVEWYAGQVTFDRRAYEINAFTVYLISRTLEHVFARLSAGFGMVGEDVYAISMKNEYLYPIFMRSSVPKHYIGPIAMQEGRILPKPKLDIKGREFRGSDLCDETQTAFTDFTKWLIDAITSRTQIEAREVLSRVAEFERRVYESVSRGERTYLNLTSLNVESGYADPLVTNYFYVMMWERAFAERFGSFVLPNKGLMIPVLAGGKAMRDPRWLLELQRFDPACHDRLQAFFESYPKKTMTSVILPTSLREVPEIFRPIINVRTVIYRNCRPFYLALKCLGIGLHYSNAEFLISDFHGAEDLPASFDAQLNLDAPSAGL